MECWRGEYLITLHACARGKVIGRVVVVVVFVIFIHKKSPDLGIWASQRLESTTNMSRLAKNWPQDA